MIGKNKSQNEQSKERVTLKKNQSKKRQGLSQPTQSKIIMANDKICIVLSHTPHILQNNKEQSMKQVFLLNNEQKFKNIQFSHILYLFFPYNLICYKYIIQKKLKMRNNKQIQQNLLTIAVIQKLKSTRGLNQVRKLANFVQWFTMDASQVLYNINQQTYLIFLCEGKLQITNKKKNNQTECEQVKKHGHCLVDRNTVKITVEEDSSFYLLKEKYILEIFQGIISLPFLTARLRQLRNIQLFSNMEKRKLIKIAFDLLQITLQIGNKLETEVIVDQHIHRYFYYIISGEIKILQKGIPICVLGPNQLFGIPPSSSNSAEHSKQSAAIGQIITETASLYKIPVQLISVENAQSKPMVEFINKRIKWRENRLNKIDRISEAEKGKRKSFMKSKASFVDKQMVLKSYYGKDIQDLMKLKSLCKVQDMKCQNRQEFYNRKLNRLRQIQQQRYGKQSQTVVLFPIPMTITIKNLCKTLGNHQLFTSAPVTPKKKKTRRSVTQESTIITKSDKRKNYSFYATTHCP